MAIDVTEIKSTFDITVPLPNLSIPREFPRTMAAKDLPFVSLIDDVITACVNNGLKDKDNQTWVLIKGGYL